MVASSSSNSKVTISDLPEYHLDSTENDRLAKPYTAKCSRVLISTLRRQTSRRNVLGHETVTERHPSFRLFPARFAKPGIENAPQGIHHRTGGSGPDLNQINILGVARGRREVELVERCASPEGQCPGQNGIGKYLDQGAA